MNTIATTAVRSPPPSGPPPPAGRAAKLSRRELGLLALVSLALAVATSWPLVLHLSTRISPDLGDPIRTAWQIAFVGHQMLTHPLSLWTSNAFWNHPESLAFSDSLLGYGPTAFVGSGPVAALVRYNLLFLWAYSLAFAGAYLLAREIGAGRIGSWVAGAAFAYAPWRLDEAGHLHVISSGGVPLTVFLLLRGYRGRRWGMVLAGWLVGAWQMSLGFTLGMQLGYLLIGLAVIVAFHLTPSPMLARPAWAAEATRRARALLPTRRLLLATALGVLALLAVTAFQARVYLHVADIYPTARRTQAEVELYSAPVRAYIAAPVHNRLWGGITAAERDRLSSQNESSLFPGSVILLLALAGLSVSVYTRRLRIGLGLTALVVAVIALGLGPDGGTIIYGPLFRHAPGIDGVRVPDRFYMLTSLALALLAAAGATALAAAVQRRTAKTHHKGSIAAAVGAVLTLAIVVEGTGHLGNPRVPILPTGYTASLPQPILYLPTDPGMDRLFQYWSTDGFPLMPNGNSTFDLPPQDSLRGGMQDFPDRLGVEKLRQIGVRTVVMDTGVTRRGEDDYIDGSLLPPDTFATPEPPDPAANARKSIAGLGLTERRVGDLAIYEINPGPGLPVG